VVLNELIDLFEFARGLPVRKTELGKEYFDEFIQAL
jgi:hypothetical protein